MYLYIYICIYLNVHIYIYTYYTIWLSLAASTSLLLGRDRGVAHSRAEPAGDVGCLDVCHLSSVKQTPVGS